MEDQSGDACRREHALRVLRADQVFVEGEWVDHSTEPEDAPPGLMRGIAAGLLVVSMGVGLVGLALLIWRGMP